MDMSILCKVCNVTMVITAAGIILHQIHQHCRKHFVAWLPREWHQLVVVIVLRITSVIFHSFVSGPLVQESMLQEAVNQKSLKSVWCKSLNSGTAALLPAARATQILLYLLDHNRL